MRSSIQKCLEHQKLQQPDIWLLQRTKNCQKLHLLYSIPTKQPIWDHFCPSGIIFFPVQFKTCQVFENLWENKTRPTHRTALVKKWSHVHWMAMGSFFCDTHDIIRLFLATATVPVVMVTFSWPKSGCNGFCHPPKGVGGRWGHTWCHVGNPFYLYLSQKSPF